MNISVIGVGKLGLCLSLNLEKKGFNVLGVDVVDDYVDSLNKKSFKSLEPYVTEYLKKSKNIKFSNANDTNIHFILHLKISRIRICISKIYNF